jgi:hypothetical protein
MKIINPVYIGRFVMLPRFIFSLTPAEDQFAEVSFFEIVSPP